MSPSIFGKWLFQSESTFNYILTMNKIGKELKQLNKWYNVVETKSYCLFAYIHTVAIHWLITILPRMAEN